ncbi:MAG TPA: DUF4335 domain-containing protein [Coleofasciculaceae cyanobacterium]
MATSVLRRYTPPTCTLEIAATGSALSRWTDRAVLKHLRFQLSFDDPTLPEDKQVTIRGDRTQLEALWETVTAYVQSLLHWTPEQMAVANPAAADLAAADLAAADLPPTAGHHTPEPPSHLTVAPTGIALHRKGLLTHDLALGSLANEQSGAVVPLSTLQLFDLANALDEYHAEALTLPALGRPAWSKSRNSWAGIAAGLLLTVGSAAALMRFVSVVSTPSSQLSASNSSAVDPNFPDKSSSRLPAAPGLEPLPSAAALQPLPPPPPVGATKNAAPPPSVSVPRTAPINPPETPAAPTLMPAPIAPPGGQVAIIPQSGLPSAANVSPNPQAGDTTLPTLRASASSEAARQATSPAEAQGGTVPATGSTAFDAIPQVAEVRNYFQRSWQPPQGLTQTLEYRLTLNADGSLQRILPLGQSAATFLDRTNMPLTNEPFVSPVENGGNPEIRLVLGQDGRVQTFLERKD